MTYFFDFVCNLAKKSNIGVDIYLLVNIFVNMLFLSSGFGSIRNIIAGIIVYAISLAIALSPIGEFVLRCQTGCKEITRLDHKERLASIFVNLVIEARKLNPSIPENIKLFISDDSEPNAFATGRKTICITNGILQYSDEYVKAVLAHELGHIAHKDTDLILIISVGNIIITCFFIFYRLIVNIICLGFSIISNRIGSVIVHFLIDGILMFLMNCWTKFGLLLVMHSSRSNEYLADKFAFDCGYGKALEEFLDTLHGVSPKGLWVNLAATHPSINDRVAKLQSLRVNSTSR